MADVPPTTDLNGGLRKALNLKPTDAAADIHVEPAVNPDTGLPEGAVAAPTADTPPVVTDPEPATPVAKVDDVDLSTLTLEGDPPADPATPDPAQLELDATEQAITDKKTRDAFIAMRRELTALKSAPEPEAVVDNTQLEAVQAELAAAHDQIGKLNLAEHPDFKKKYTGPYDAKLAQAAQYAEAAGASVETIEAAAAMPLMERAQVVTEQFGSYAPIVMNLLADMDGISAERLAELSTWQESKAVLDAEQSQQQSFVQSEMSKQTFTEAVASMQQENFLPFMYIDGNEAWNGTVDKIQAEALALFQRDDLPAQAKAMAQGVAAPHLLKSYVAERKRNIALTAQLAELGGAVPRINNNSPTPPQPQKKEATPNGSSARQAGARAAQRFAAQ